MTIGHYACLVVRVIMAHTLHTWSLCPFHGRGHLLRVSMWQHCAWLIVPMGVAEAAVGELCPDRGGSGQHACLMGSCLGAHWGGKLVQ